MIPTRGVISSEDGMGRADDDNDPTAQYERPGYDGSTVHHISLARRLSYLRTTFDDIPTNIVLLSERDQRQLSLGGHHLLYLLCVFYLFLLEFRFPSHS
jgi:hypothetical protein